MAHIRGVVGSTFTTATKYTYQKFLVANSPIFSALARLALWFSEPPTDRQQRPSPRESRHSSLTFPWRTRQLASELKIFSFGQKKLVIWYSYT